MKISGSVAPTSSQGGADGNISFWAGSDGGSDGNKKDVITQALFTGGGQMDISSPTGGNTGGDIVVRQTDTSSGNHNAILDLSGLSSFNANVDQLLIAYTTASGPTRPSGNMYLAQNNTITLNNTGALTGTGTSFASGAEEGGLIIGLAGNTTNGTPTSVLYLGQTNTINVQNAYIAARRETATMTFNPNFTSPSLKMRGIDGASRVSLISIGDNTGNGSSSTNTANGTIDLTGGNVDIMASTIQLGTSTYNDTGHSNNGAGTLTFDTGTIDVTTLIVGNQTAILNTRSSSNADQGTVNVNGTANLIVGAGGITLGKWAGPGTGLNDPGASVGTLNIRSTATVTMNGDIVAGGVPYYSLVVNDIGYNGSYSTISMSGGTLNMNGHKIGNAGSTLAPLGTFTANGGTVTNSGGIWVNTFKATKDYSLTGGLTLVDSTAGAAAIIGTIDMRNSAGNTLTLDTLNMPVTTNLNFELSSNNASGNDQINVTNLNLGGGTTTVTVSPLSTSFSGGTYNLINYTHETGSTTWAITNTTRNLMRPGGFRLKHQFDHHSGRVTQPDMERRH